MSTFFRIVIIMCVICGMIPAAYAQRDSSKARTVKSGTAKSAKPAKSESKAEAAPKSDEPSTNAASAETANASAASADASKGSDPADALNLSKFKAIRLVEVGTLVSNFSGAIDSMTDGVKLVLLSNDPTQKELPINANDIKFTWPDGGGKMPKRIVMTGKVLIQHPQLNIRAEKADWDFDKQTITFTGNPVMTSDQVKNLRGESIIINLKDKTTKIKGGTADTIQLNSSEDLGGPATGGSSSSVASGGLSEGDITDWTAFITKIKTDSDKNGTVAQSLLNTSARDKIKSNDVATIVKHNDLILREINKTLASPSFYNANAWSGITLSAQAQELLAKKDSLSASELVQLNRLLLEAAYPGLVKSSQ